MFEEDWWQREKQFFLFIFGFSPELSIPTATTSCQVIIIFHLGHCSHLHTGLSDSILVLSSSSPFSTLYPEWHFKSIKLVTPCLCLKLSGSLWQKPTSLALEGIHICYSGLTSHPAIGPLPLTAPSALLFTQILYLPKPNLVNFLRDAYLSHCLYTCLPGIASNLPMGWNA